MTDSEILENYQQPLPVSFKVIGTGTRADEVIREIIEEVKSFGYDCIGYTIAHSPSECIPTDEDKMAIIVAIDNEDVANAIAKTYHDAGVLTIGLVPDPIPSFYDSVYSGKTFKYLPTAIKTLLQPIFTPSYVSYDFYDLNKQLRDSGFFKTLTVETENVAEAVTGIQKSLAEIDVNEVDYLSALLYYNKESGHDIKMEDMAYLSNMLSSLPETVNAVWSVNFDDAMPADKIRLSIIISGKRLI